MFWRVHDFSLEMLRNNGDGEGVLDRLKADTTMVNSLLERFGFEQALPDHECYGVGEKVRLVHVLLQLLNSKLVLH